jgi:integrase
VSKWFHAYYDAAERGEVGKKNNGKPQASAGDRRDRFANWLESRIGHLGMNEVTDDHLRDIVRMLDDEIRKRVRWYESGCDDDEREERTGKMRKPGLSSKTSSHIWSEVTSGFKEAVSSKLKELRVLKSNPTVGVAGPIRLKVREQEALFPSEVVKLLSCEDVPLHRRRCYAVALYTGLRRSELERLTADAINFDHEVITVVGTKTDAALRQVPIEPALMPLLRKLVKEAPTGPLLDVPKSYGHDGASAVTKRDIETAKLTRADLYRDDAHFMPYTFHAHRHSCITMWSVAGKSQLFLLTVAGHMDVTMTKKYLGKAASVSKKFGTPHPPLPLSLLGGATVVSLDTKRRTA